MINFEKLKAREGRDFVVYPQSDVGPTPVGHDLEIGAAAIVGNPDSKGNYEIQFYNEFDRSNNIFVIPPQGFILFVTRQHVWLSGHVAGLLFSRGSLASRGIFLAASTIDPNWSGQMMMRLFNSNQHAVDINCADPVVTMSLFYTTGSSEHRETRNPFRVLSNISSIVGSAVSDQINYYVQSAETTERRAKFDQIVDVAKKYTYKNYIYRKLIDVADIIPGSRPSSKIARVLLSLIMSIFITCALTYALYRSGFVDVNDPGSITNVIVFGLFTVLSNVLSIALIFATPNQNDRG